MRGSSEYLDTLKINYTLKGCFIASKLSNIIIPGGLLILTDKGDMVDRPRAVKML